MHIFMTQVVETVNGILKYMNLYFIFSNTWKFHTNLWKGKMGQVHEELVAPNLFKVYILKVFSSK